MNIDMFVEGDNTDYDSVFNLLIQSKIVFQKTEFLLKNLQQIIESRDYEVCSLEDLLIKFYFHGLRITRT